MIRLVAVLLALLVPASAEAQLKVGTKEAPPFALKTPEGEWAGLSIELWQAIADEHGLEYEISEHTLDELLNGVANGELDLAVAAITITADREDRMDFSHPFYSTGIGVAVSSGTGGRGWLVVAERLVSRGFLLVLGLLVLVLFGVGVLVWMFEARRNKDQFGGKPGKGLGSGFWWAAVTMTTVGYGDKAPITPAGRFVALIWMFTSLIVISSFTAGIAASLTVGELSGRVTGFGDLPLVRVGAIEGSTSARYLTLHGVGFASYSDARSGLQAVRDGRLDAFVHDEPLLNHLARTEFPGHVILLPETFGRQDYGIAMPSGSTMREELNHALLEYIDSEDWLKLETRYLGVRN